MPGQAARSTHDRHGALVGPPARKPARHAARLGSLNAANAAEPAFANAAPNSTVGRIAAYRAAIEDGRIDDAALALSLAANKEVDLAVVQALNDKLAVDVDPETEAAVAEATAELQAAPPPRERRPEVTDIGDARP